MDPNHQAARTGLIRRLRMAYSGELAAARAYAGHWRSVRDPEQKQRIKEILEEELVHHRRVGEMLGELGARPGRLRDAWFAVVGTLIAASCFLGGWYIPMVGAGRIESRNIREYEDAARLAVAAGCLSYVPEFLHMAEVEWDHEQYFHDLARGHRLHRWVGAWPDPPPRAEIRASFRREHPAAVQDALTVASPSPPATVAPVQPLFL